MITDNHPQSMSGPEPGQARGYIDPDHVLSLMAGSLSLDREDILTSARSGDRSQRPLRREARQVYVWVLVRFCGLSTYDAADLAGIDRSTVCTSIKDIDALRALEPGLVAWMDELCEVAAR